MIVTVLLLMIILRDEDDVDVDDVCRRRYQDQVGR